MSKDTLLHLVKSIKNIDIFTPFPVEGFQALTGAGDFYSDIFTLGDNKDVSGYFRNESLIRISKDSPAQITKSLFFSVNGTLSGG